MSEGKIILSARGKTPHTKPAQDRKESGNQRARASRTATWETASLNVARQGGENQLDFCVQLEWVYCMSSPRCPRRTAVEGTGSGNEPLRWDVPLPSVGPSSRVALVLVQMTRYCTSN